jgi:hypothetical protein
VFGLYPTVEPAEQAVRKRSGESDEDGRAPCAESVDNLNQPLADASPYATRTRSTTGRSPALLFRNLFGRLRLEIREERLEIAAAEADKATRPKKSPHIK